MSSIYEGLINKLKSKFELKNIKFTTKNFKKIMNKDITRKNKNIKQMLDEDELIKEIVNELVVIGTKLSLMLLTLKGLNELLIIFKEEPQPSKRKARKLLKEKVVINLFDLVAEKYEKRTTYEKLREDMENNPDRTFPLWLAKTFKGLQFFLQHIREK
jgi:hypothetical protein